MLNITQILSNETLRCKINVFVLYINIDINFYIDIFQIFLY